MSCSQAAASSRSASAPRTDTLPRARAATPWTCAQRRGRGSCRSARASCSAQDADVFMRPKLDSCGGTFTGVAGRSKDVLFRGSVRSAAARRTLHPGVGFPRVLDGTAEVMKKMTVATWLPGRWTAELPGYRKPAEVCDHERVPRGRPPGGRDAARCGSPCRGRWRAWEAVRADFERALADPADPAIASAEIVSELRRVVGYVRVMVALIVITTDVADALAVAWDAFRSAARWSHGLGGDCRRGRVSSRSRHLTVPAVTVNGARARGSAGRLPARGVRGHPAVSSGRPGRACRRVRSR